MDRLKGKTILIGKEPENGRLLIFIPGAKGASIGAPGSVPPCVSRCKPKEGVAHAKITVDQNGNMTLTNMKSENVTYVNGSEIASKHITTSSNVELGKDRFKLNLPTVIDVAKKLVGDVEPKRPFNISHLEHVWNNLQAQRKAIQAKQRKINLIRSGCGIFTMCAMPCIFLFGPIGYALTGIGIVGNIYSFVGLKNDNTADAIEKLNEEFQDRYVCPKCNKFLGNNSYKFIKKQYGMHCPYCKCEYVER